MGLRKSKPEAPGASDPASPEEEPPSHLELASTEAASLLAQQRLAEAADVLFQSLRALEDQTELLSGRELVALGTAVSAACTTLAWASPPLSPQSVQLAFGASALVARLAMRVVRDRPEDLLSPTLDHLQLFGGFMSTAWYPGSLLAQQTIDNNRYVLLLGEIMSQVNELPAEHRHVWAELAARCSMSDLWTSQYFMQHLQSLLAVWPLLSEPTAAVLAASLQASCELAPSGAAGTWLLERVLRFQQAWPEGAKSWEWQRPSLALVTSGRPLTPAHCLAAFMLSQLPTKAALSACLARESGFLAQCAFTAALDCCDPGRHVELLAGLCETLVSELLPVRLLDVATADLESHRRSALCQVLVPRFCLAIGRCAATLAEEVQVTRFAEPLEQWTLSVNSHAAARASGPARRWFTSSVFLAIATIAREARIQQLGSRVLFKLLRAMSCVDMFREDSQEYRAICLSIVECRCAQGDDFHRAMLDTLSELEATKNAAGAYKNPINSRLHFWLGMLATPSILENAMFFPVAWTPILRISSTGESAIAARAVALAAMAIDSQKRRSSETESQVWQVLEAGLDGFAMAEGDEMLQPLHSLVDIIMAEQARGKQALDLHRDVLKSLARRVLEHQEAPASTKPLGFFGLFCTAARSLDSSLSEAVFTDGRLGELLAEPSRRELWLRHLAARFPEKPRTELVRWFLARHPSAVAAWSWSTPSSETSEAPVLGSAL